MKAWCSQAFSTGLTKLTKGELMKTKVTKSRILGTVRRSQNWWRKNKGLTDGYYALEALYAKFQRLLPTHHSDKR